MVEMEKAYGHGLGQMTRLDRTNSTELIEHGPWPGVFVDVRPLVVKRMRMLVGLELSMDNFPTDQRHCGSVKVAHSRHKVLCTNIINLSISLHIDRIFRTTRLFYYFFVVEQYLDIYWLLTVFDLNYPTAPGRFDAPMILMDRVNHKN
jgi:hypothetical protein